MANILANIWTAYRSDSRCWHRPGDYVRPALHTDRRVETRSALDQFRAIDAPPRNKISVAIN